MTAHIDKTLTNHNCITVTLLITQAMERTIWLGDPNLMTSCVTLGKLIT